MKKVIIMFLFLTNSLVYAQQKAVVCVPVTSLFAKPNPDDAKGPYKYPLFSINRVPNHKTQLLLGERLETTGKSENSWIEIYALEQQVIDRESKEWQGFRGWIKACDVQLIDQFISCNAVVNVQLAYLYPKADLKSKSIMTLSIGTLLKIKNVDAYWDCVKIPDGRTCFIESKNLELYDTIKKCEPDQLRQKLVAGAKTFLESPYSFGGRSAYQKDATNFISSVDCSSLVDLTYRLCFLPVPRNSYFQRKQAKEIAPVALLPGDLIFIKHKERTTHVMMWLGDGDIIEAYGSGNKKECKTRVIKDIDRLGKPVAELSNGDQCSDGKDTFQIYCGSFLSDQKNIHELQDKLVKGS